MKYFNHVTLNTGHSRKSYPNEVLKVNYPHIKKVYEDMFKEGGTDVLNGFIAKGYDYSENGTYIRLFSPQGVPILTTGIVKSKNSNIWKTLHSLTVLPTVTDPFSPPELPFVADCLDIGATLYPEALRWTGDFTRTMGWMCLSPKSIKKYGK